MSTSDSVWILVFIGIVIISIVIAYYQKKKQQEILQYQAEKRNGRIEKGNFLAPDRLVLPFGSQELQVYSIPGGKNRPSKTIAELRNNNTPFPQIKIVRNNLFQKALETFGRERFLSGDEEFDKTFVVQADDNGSARRALPYEIQKSLLEMASKSPSIEISPQNFKLIILRVIRDSEGYDLFIDTALAILNKLK